MPIARPRSAGGKAFVMIESVAGIISAGILIISLFVAATQVRAGWGSDLRAWLAAAAVETP